MEKELIAHDLASKAERTLKGNFCTNWCKSLSLRRFEAYDKYKQAANMFKSIQKWEEAAECFQKCGEINEQIKPIFTDDYEESALYFGQINKKKQSEISPILLRIYEKNANFTAAGTLKFKIAVEHEKGCAFDLAIESYLKSAEYYSKEGVNEAKQTISLLKAADLMCIKEHKDAFSEGVKDISSGELALDKFINWDPSFIETLEYDFIINTMDSIKADNLHSYKAAVTKLHLSSAIDSWGITILTIIQGKITGGKYVGNAENNNELIWQ